ncbi:MAG: MFS transporter [Burkholderiales bacterium]
MSAQRLGTGGLAGYGILALPLAIAALPVYVHLPNLYGGVLGLNLAVLGAVLLCARLADAMVDPLLGALNDQLQRPRLAIGLGMAMLAAGTLMAFNPPADGFPLWLWLACALVPVYLGYSLVSVSYLAWGALLGDTTEERTRVAAFREGFGIAGVVLASILPTLLGANAEEGLSRFSFILVPAAAACAGIMLLCAPRPDPLPGGRSVSLNAMLVPLANPAFRPLFAVFMLNGIASALPATLVLFFVDDILRAPHLAGMFLGLYFVAGATSLPAWLALCRRIGNPAGWFLAMMLSVAAFSGALLLGEGNIVGFGAICVASGLALGADLALPPAMLADTVRSAGHESRAGAYFGLWTLATKLNLALAAGIALPLLALFGYTPGTPATVWPLYVAYCVLPCAMKLCAAFMLRSKFTLRKAQEGNPA